MPLRMVPPLPFPRCVRADVCFVLDHAFEHQSEVGIVDKITRMAFESRFKDLMLMSKFFIQWANGTNFHPKPSISPTVDYDAKCKVMDFLEYGREREYYMRPRHCAGVLFVTFLRKCYGVDNVGVAWTSKHQALFYKYDHSARGWVRFKHMNRQPDPYRTWSEHLYRFYRKPYVTSENAFRNLVVPYFGWHHKLPLSYYYSIPPIDHDVWEVVKLASYDTVAVDDPVRFEWKPISEVEMLGSV